MASLATALTVTGAVFSNHLTYLPGMAPRATNRTTLEARGMQVLPREDVKTLGLCQRMLERGEWPPPLVVYDPVEGFTVEADRFTRDLTIITEYVGDVDYLRNREHDDGDSMMTLLSAAAPSRSLVICPDRHSNIESFINGINNHTPWVADHCTACSIREGRKKQNLNCVRFDGGGECRVLLVTNRDISKDQRGETLLRLQWIGATSTPRHALTAFGVPPSVRKDSTTQELGKSIERWPSMNHNATSCRRATASHQRPDA
ncbi:hypothetical protein U9M48_009650 [Paspalum notatum var. saurae]|uniref:Uncharacterized protein n=1 Tax=Paspalum notatum var. saurae TaxID=547442 RepID=A0AAQ3SS88_PASNO